MPIRILIADDHEMILRGLADGFRADNDFTVVGAAITGHKVIELYKIERPDVVLLDYRLPGKDGDQITEELLKVDPEAKVLMFSSFDWEEDIWRSVIAGALGYVTKTSRLAKLHEAVRTVARGERYLPLEILAKLQAREQRAKFTGRELETLTLLAKGFGNQAIAAELRITEATVKTHVSRILRKMDANDRTHAVVKAVERGMVRCESPGCDDVSPSIY